MSGQSSLQRYTSGCLNRVLFTDIKLFNTVLIRYIKLLNIVLIKVTELLKTVLIRDMKLLNRTQLCIAHGLNTGAHFPLHPFSCSSIFLPGQTEQHQNW